MLNIYSYFLSLSLVFFALACGAEGSNYKSSKKITVDHHVWDEILTRYVTADALGVNRFNYSGFTDESAEELDAYLDFMQNIDVERYSRSEQKAYWINLYNAFTVYVILDEYPIESILELGEDSSGPWDDKIIDVRGRSLSLNDVEHTILRKEWTDARIHFGVNCASIGCPNLLRTAYTGSNIELLLEQAARDFLSHSRGMRFDEGVLVLSSIFEWFKQDFGENDKEVLQTLSRYVDSPVKERLIRYNGKIKYQYDWALNE